MDNYRIKLSSKQTLKLKQLRAHLTETLPAGDIEEEYPTTHSATCGGTCLYACDGTCFPQCSGTCFAICTSSCWPGCSGTMRYGGNSISS